MRKIKNLTIKCFIFLLVAICLVSVTSCKKRVEDKDPIKPTEQVTIKLEADKDRFNYNETVNLKVTVTGSEDKTYDTEVSNPKIAKVEDNVLSAVGNIVVDKTVTVTVTSHADPNAKDSKTFIIKGKTIEGQVGELTSAMLQEIGNESITIKGSLTDYYVNFHDADQNTEHAYGMTVEMAADIWKGSWYSEEDDTNVITDTYRKSAQDGLRDQNGNKGHGLEKLYIDKDNKVSSTLVKDYVSVPTLWESQHLWNHLGQLNVNKFKYDLENDLYEYSVDYTNEDDLYLMTYLSFSLTPMLSDTLDKIYLKIEDGRITKLLAQTEILYYGADTQEDADAMSYTSLEITFSKIGTTEVSEPEVYEAPEQAELLVKALNEMKSLRNYTFNLVDTQTYAPSGDSGDYELTSATTSNEPLFARLAKKNKKPVNYTSSTGTVGLVGKVTEDAVLFAETGLYSYTMDGKPYHTEYSGYKKIDENTYDYFEYDYKNKALTGQRQYQGTFFDSLPNFEFSPNIFTLDGAITKKGKIQYTFKINDSAITREVALQLAVYDFAKDGAASTYSTLRVTVDEDGHLVKVVFPYSINSATYLGYYTVTYSKFNTTTLDDDTFEGYVPRVLRTSWSQFTTKYYSETPGTATHEENTDVVLKTIYGDNLTDFVSPTIFSNVFGDCLYGPFFDWKEKGTDADGNKIYTGYMNINTRSDKFDENSQVTNYDEIISALREALEKEGFKYSVENSDTTGGDTGRSDRYVCFIKGDVQIVVWNNFTKNFSIYFYKTGDWKLRK